MHIYARFHADVQGTLDRVPLAVEEWAVPLTPALSTIQASLLALLDGCLYDLRRAHPSVRALSHPFAPTHPHTDTYTCRHSPTSARSTDAGCICVCYLCAYAMASALVADTCTHMCVRAPLPCLSLSLSLMVGVQIDVAEFTVENALSRSFDAVVRQQLDPIWHRVTARTRRILADIRTLRALSTYAHQSVCVHVCVCVCV
jgi:hypothetical protein